MANEHIEYLRTVDPSVIGMMGAVFTLFGGLVNQDIVNRERLIDYLLGTLADLSPTERQEPRAMFLQMFVQLFELTQFPPSSDEGPH